MKCSGDLWRRKLSLSLSLANGSGIFLFLSPPPPPPPPPPALSLSLPPSMKMINGIAHKVNSTREIAFYL